MRCFCIRLAKNIQDNTQHLVWRLFRSPESGDKKVITNEGLLSMCFIKQLLAGYSLAEVHGDTKTVVDFTVYANRVHFVLLLSRKCTFHEILKRVYTESREVDTYFSHSYVLRFCPSDVKAKPCKLSIHYHA